jgi:excisionase family DNA binding protein
MPRKRTREAPPTARSPASVHFARHDFDALTESSPQAHSLTQLVRMIARQAAQEAFEVFKSALEARGVRPARECSVEHESHRKAERGCSSPVSDERFLSVREAATRLDVSEKTVRRKIQAGDLPARRFGKLLRIRERDLLLRLSVDRPEAADNR